MLAFGVVCDLGVGPTAGGRSRNEDNFLVCADSAIHHLEDGSRVHRVGTGESVLLAVCDGMGGHDDGHVASTTAVKVLAKLFKPGAPKRPARALLRYIAESQRSLHYKARETGGEVVMGTTLTVAWLINGQLSWAQVGDSHLYLYRNHQIFCLTPDHTRNEFLRRDGRPEQANGKGLVQAFIYGSRGLGDNASLRLELGLDAGMERVFDTDRLLLTSDGIHGVLSEGQICGALALADPQAAADELAALAKRFGSTDNMTALVADVGSVPGVGAGGEWFDEGEETIQF